ncbi:MAG TPA: hypothetical protein VGD17_07215 [Chitinophagaceae bacterium]
MNTLSAGKKCTTVMTYIRYNLVRKFFFVLLYTFIASQVYSGQHNGKGSLGIFQVRNADTTRPGNMSAADKKKLDRMEVISNETDLRSVGNPRPDVIYRFIKNGMIGDFYWSPASTADEDSIMVVKKAGAKSGRFLRYFENYILVDWFGATAGDATDDSYAVQKAINFAVTSSKSPEIRFSGGNYIVNNVVIYNPAKAGEFTFVTATLKGSNFLVSPGTSLTCNDVNGFSVAVQSGRNVKIENITFVGQAPQPGNYKNVITWTDAQWTKGVRNHPNSPYAAIAIDPFSSSVPGDARYPRSASFYANKRTGGSSMILIRDCSFKYFVAAIAVNTSIDIYNGDNIVATGCYFEMNKNVWVTGQTQSRANLLEKSYMLFNQYIINGKDYGKAIGTAPMVSECNIAGGTKYLYHINSDFAGISFTRCRTESLWSLGKSVSISVNFTDCEITMSIPGNDEAFAARLLAEGTHINFRGGTLEWFDNNNVAAFPFSVQNLSFDGVTLRGLPLNFQDAGIGQILLNKTVYQNCQFFSPQSNTVWAANTWHNIEYSNFNNTAVMPGTQFIEQNPHDASFYNIGRSVSPKIEVTGLDRKKIMINPETCTGYFIASDAGAFQVRDVLVTLNNVSYSGDIYKSLPTTLGWVYAINKDTVKLNYVPYGIVSNREYDINLVRVPRFICRTFGKATAGSNTITARQDNGTTFVVGSLIKGPGIPAGTRVTAVGASTLTLSRKATQTGTFEFHDAVMKWEGYSSQPERAIGKFGFGLGDVIHNTLSDATTNSIAYWVCTAAGFTDGRQPVAKFSPVMFGR